MKRAIGQAVGRALVGSLAAAFTLCLIYSYYALWQAHVHATLTDGDVPGSEARLILAAVLASIATVAATLFAWWERRKSLRTERERKVLELRAEAAFEMWKAATAAYRLLGKAEISRFGFPDSQAIQTAFEDAEKKTLLFPEDLILTFQTLWQESERLAEELLRPENMGRQPAVREAQLKAYAEIYRELKQQLKDSLSG